MTRLRLVLVVALALLLGVFVPVAMASSHCALMSGMCEGPCGASVTIAPPTVPAFTGLVSRAPLMPGPAVPQPAPRSLEQPPKSPALSA